jgi:hypothetical protein
MDRFLDPSSWSVPDFLYQKLSDFLNDTLGHDPRFSYSFDLEVPTFGLEFVMTKIRFNGRYVFSVSLENKSSKESGDCFSPMIHVFIEMSELGHYEDYDTDSQKYSVVGSSKYLYGGSPEDAKMFLLKYSIEIYQQYGMAESWLSR